MRWISYILIGIGILLSVTALYSSLCDFKIIHWQLFQWVFLGIGIYFILMKFSFINKNRSFLQVLSHEFLHCVVALLFFRKILDFRATLREGFIRFEEGFGEIFISLAPYCFPFFTYILLILASISSFNSVFEILTGLSIGFYCDSFHRQTKNYQTDIQKEGIVRAYMFILMFWLFNSTIFLLSIKEKGIIKAVKYLFLKYWEHIAFFFSRVF